MANVTVTTTQSNVAVTQNYSNITVTEANSNVTVASIANALTNVSVTATPTNVFVSQTAVVSNASVREKISVENVSGFGNLTYDNSATSNGVIQYTGIANSDIWSTITTTNVSGFGNIAFDQGNGDIEYTGTSNADIIGVIVDNPANIRQHFSAIDPVQYNSTSGVISVNNTTLLSGQTTSNLTEGTNLYYTDARARGSLSNVYPILYNSTTGEISANTDAIFSNSLANAWFTTQTTDDLTEGSTNLYWTTDRGNTTIGNYLTSKGVSIDGTNNWTFANNIHADNFVGNFYNMGNVSGNVDILSANGMFHAMRIIGDANISLSGTGNTYGYENIIFIEMDEIGGHNVSFVANAGSIGWNFTNNIDAVTTTANAISVVQTVYDSVTGTTNQRHHASMFTFDDPAISIAGNITTTANVTGAYLHGDGSNITNISPSNITGLTTDDVTEGSNLYYTTARANSAISTYFGDSANFPFTFEGNLNVNGNVEVDGNLNYRNVEDLYVRDQKIVLNANAATDANVEIISNRPVAGANTSLLWDETADKWKFTNDGTTYYDIPTSTDDLAEGLTNLYFANSLVDNWLTGKTTDDLTEGSTNLYYANSLVGAYLPTYTGNLDSVGNVIVSGLIKADTIDPYTAFGTVRMTSPRLSDVGIGSSGNSYFLPDAAPTDGQVLVGYSNATVQWEAQSGLSNAFATVNVSGQANVVASGDDTLVFAEGSGMTITTDAANNTVTFASSGSGYSNTDVQNFLENGYSTANIDANDIVAVTFSGDGSDLTDVRAESVEVTLKNVSGADITKGYPVHATGYSGSGEVECILADAGNALTMPAHFIAQDTMANAATGRGILAGRIQNVDTSSFSVGDTIYVAVGGGYANTAPTGEANVIQNLGVVTRIDATQGGGEVMGAGRSAATPNLNNGNIFVGDSNNQAVSIDLDAFTYRIASNANIETTANISVSDLANTTMIQNGGDPTFHPYPAVGTVKGYFSSQMLDLFKDETNTSNPLGTTDPFINVVGGGASIRVYNDATPSLNVENGLQMNQGSNQANSLYSTPRYAFVKYADSDFANGSYGTTSDGDWTSTIDTKARRNRWYKRVSDGFIFPSSFPTVHSVAAIVTKTANTSANVESTQSTTIGGTDYYTIGSLANGIIAFKTQQFDVANSATVLGNTAFPYNESLDFPESTAVFIDDTLNVGSDEGTYYRFPPDPGSNGQVLQLDANNHLQWTTLSGTGTVTSIDVAGGVGLNSTGGPITTSGTITLDLANTTVSAGVYGDATNVPQITVDAQGRITSATNVAISGGTGTVTSVTAGAGLTQSGNANLDPTVDVVGGYGITVNADDIEVTNSEIQAQANVAIGNNSNIVLTDSAQTITAIKTFESNVILSDFSSSSNSNVAVTAVIGQFNAGRPSDIWTLSGHSSQIFADGTAVTANSFSDPTLSSYNTNVYYTKWNAAESGYEIYTNVGLTANVSIGGSSYYGSPTGQAEYVDNVTVNSVLHVDEITTSDANTSNAITFNAPINTALKQFNETTVTTANVSGATTFDVSTGSIFKANVTGNITSLALTNAVAGTSATLILTQGATTGTLTAGASWLWAGGTKTLSTSTGDVDVISVVYDGTNYYASLTTGYVT